MWRIWWAPNNASKWQIGFNSVFKGLIYLCPVWSMEIHTEKKLMLLHLFKEENLPEAKCILIPWALIRHVGTVKGQTAAP
jgi:hypothetical protein